MPKVWSITSQRGFSAVEILLAATLFGALVTALIGAIVYGRASVDTAGDRARASMIAEEGIEAARNIRDSAYANLTVGTFGIAQSGSQWTLSGTSDTTDIYTRQVIIAAAGTNRKSVTSTVSWTQAGQTRQVSATTQLTNWKAAIKSWLTATYAGAYDAASTNNGIEVATEGNYAYVVRSDGTPDFLIVNISNPAAPTLVGSLSLAGIPTDVALNGNYAYVSNSGDSTEFQVVNITNPATPTLSGTYDALGAADGLAVTVSGGYAWLSRAANSGIAELSIVNITNPASPSLAGSYGNNNTMRAVYVANNYAYIGTDSDTQEVMIVNFTGGLTFPPVAATINLTGTNNVTAIEAVGNTLFIGQGAILYAYNITNPAAPALLGSVTTTGSGVINDLDFDSTGTYAFLGTAATAAEFQVVTITNPASMAISRIVDLAGTASALGGVAYNTTLNSVAGASAADTLEAPVFIPN